MSAVPIYLLESVPVVSRAWAMPNSQTFALHPVRSLMEELGVGPGWVDPFAGTNRVAQFTNDSDVEALDFLAGIADNVAEGVLLDPPYSARQVREMYKGRSCKALTPVLDEARRILRVGGLAVSFGWNSNGLGKTRGMRMERVLLIAHGAQHNDTIVTVERKVLSAPHPGRTE